MFWPAVGITQHRCNNGSQQMDLDWAFALKDGVPQISRQSLIPGGSVEISHENLFGDSQSLSVSLSASDWRNPGADLGFQMSYTEPFYKPNTTRNLQVRGRMRSALQLCCQQQRSRLAPPLLLLPAAARFDSFAAGWCLRCPATFDTFTPSRPSPIFSRSLFLTHTTLPTQIQVFNTRKMSPIFTPGAEPDVPPVFVDRFGAKGWTSHVGGQDNKVEHALLLQQIQTVDENGQPVSKVRPLTRRSGLHCKLAASCAAAAQLLFAANDPPAPPLAFAHNC